MFAIISACEPKRYIFMLIDKHACKMKEALDDHVKCTTAGKSLLFIHQHRAVVIFNLNFMFFDLSKFVKKAIFCSLQLKLHLTQKENQTNFSIMQRWGMHFYIPFLKKRNLLFSCRIHSRSSFRELSSVWMNNRIDYCRCSLCLLALSFSSVGIITV